MKTLLGLIIVIFFLIVLFGIFYLIGISGIFLANLFKLTDVKLKFNDENINNSVIFSSLIYLSIALLIALAYQLGQLLF